MEKEFPKVLIIGESFHTFSGGGITMNNLFGTWSGSKLAVADVPINIQKMNSERTSCNYQLGSKEFKMFFPFNLIGKHKESSANIKTRGSLERELPKSSNEFDFKLRKIGLELLHFFGAFHLMNTVSLTKQLKTWIEEVKPDFIYTQLSQRNLIILITLIENYYKIPLVIHIMDDWPRTINKKGLFKKFWDRKIEKEFQFLITRSHSSIAISEKMAVEYELRYGNKWEYFHNPIDVKKWEENIKKNYCTNKNIKVLYMGRIGSANSNSIPTFSNVINTLNLDNENRVDFDIYTPNFYEVDHLRNEHVHVFQSIDHNNIPQLLKQYDLLYLPLDFDYTSKLFSEFSIPTKLTEYMISGVPILVNAPEDTALVSYCSKHDLAFICTTNDEKTLIDFFLKIFSKPKRYAEVGKKAARYAQKNHCQEEIQQKFKNIFK